MFVLLGSVPSLLLLSLAFCPIDSASSPDVFTATISNMPCSLFLVLGRKGRRENGPKLRKKKSLVECSTKKKVFVNNALVINDDTGHIFNLTLDVNARKTKLIKGNLIEDPQGYYTD